MAMTLRHVAGIGCFVVAAVLLVAAGYEFIDLWREGRLTVATKEGDPMTIVLRQVSWRCPECDIEKGQISADPEHAREVVKNAAAKHMAEKHPDVPYNGAEWAEASTRRSGPTDDAAPDISRQQEVDMNQVQQTVKEITDKLDWLARSHASEDHKRVNAEEHGRVLAKAVTDYMADPEYLGRDYLGKAVRVFYAGSSGGFNQSPDEVIASLEAQQKASA